MNIYSSRIKALKIQAGIKTGKKSSAFTIPDWGHENANDKLIVGETKYITATEQLTAWIKSKLKKISL